MQTAKRRRAEADRLSAEERKALGRLDEMLSRLFQLDADGLVEFEDQLHAATEIVMELNRKIAKAQWE